MKPFSVAIILFAVLATYGVMAYAADVGPSKPDASPNPPAKAAKVEVKKEDVKITVEEPVNPVEEVSSVVKFIKDKDWRPAVAGIITLIIFVWRRFLGKLLIDKIPAKHMAWVTAAVGLVATLPAHLTAESFKWTHFILDGFITGAEAAILWSLVGKHLLPKIFGEVKKDEPAATTEG